MKPLLNRKNFLFFLLLIVTLYTYSSTPISIKEPKAVAVFFTLHGTSISLSLADYANLKPSDFKRLTGQKLTLKEAIAFKIAQRQIKKTVRKDGTVDLLAFHKKSSKPFKWHWGGFFLGLLLPIVGLVIAAFINDDKKKDRANSAAIGTLIACAAFLLFVLSSF